MFKDLFKVPIFNGKLDNWKKYNRDLLPLCKEIRKETDDMSDLPWNCNVWSTYAYDDQLFKRSEFQEVSRAIATYVRSYLDRRQWKGDAKILMTELWVNHQTMLINEMRLTPVDPKARKFLEEEMEKFFFGDGSQAPQGFVPEK